MNKRLERYIRAGILFAWPLTGGGMALAQSVPGNGMAVPDVGGSGAVGASPSGSTSNAGEMGASPAPPVNPGDQPPMPGAPQVAPPDTSHPPPSSARPPEAVPPTPGAPRPGTANQSQGTPLPPDVVPRDAAAGQVRDVAPRPGGVDAGARQRTQRSTRAGKKGRRVRHDRTRPDSTSSETPGGTGRIAPP
jgi:hypothetical protein